MVEKENNEWMNSKEAMMISMFVSDLEEGYLKKKLINFVNDEFKRTEATLLHLAVKDGRITEDEISSLIKEYKTDRSEISQIFKVFYDEGFIIDDGSDEKIVKMLTIKGSGIWRMRHHIKKRYGLIVVDGEQAMKDMMEIEEKKSKKEAKEASYIG